MGLSSKRGERVVNLRRVVSGEFLKKLIRAGAPAMVWCRHLPLGSVRASQDLANSVTCSSSLFRRLSGSCPLCNPTYRLPLVTNELPRESEEATSQH